MSFFVNHIGAQFHISLIIHYLMNKLHIQPTDNNENDERMYVLQRL